MKFKDFMDMYDNWNGTTVVNDDNLDMIAKGKTSSIVEWEDYLWDVEVVAFGFYDNELCVRLKYVMENFS